MVTINNLFNFEFSQKTKNIFRIIGLVFTIALAFYVTGVVGQFADVMMIHKSKEAFTFNPIVCYQYAFNFEYSKFGWIAIAVITIVILAYSLTMSDKRGVLGGGEKDRNRNFEYSSKDNYGSARQQSENDIRHNCKVLPLHKFAETKGDIILGYLNEKYKDYVLFPENNIMKGINYNRNLAVCGGPGSRKTRTFVVNYILQAIERGESIIVSDTKGEIYSFTKRIAEKKGYKVKILNLIEQDCSDGWDILDEVKNNPEMATLLADVVIKNTGGLKGDQFWDDAEQNCLKAIVLLKSVGECDISNVDGKPSTMGDVYKFIATKTLDDMAAVFNFIDDNLPQHPALIPYKQFLNAGNDVCKKILHGLGNRLQLFQNEQLCKVLGTKDIDIEEAGKQKCIYYLRFSDQVSTYQFITSLFFSFLFIKLVALADRQPKRQLDVFVNFLLDEFPNIGQIPDFTYKISTVRSRGINIAAVFQNLPQLQNRYPDGMWEEIISDCDTFIFLGCGNEITTPEYVSALTGETTINVGSSSMMIGTADIRATAGTGRGVVMTPNQVKTLSPNSELIFIKGMQVMQLTKMDFTKHPFYKEMEKLGEENVTEHISIVEKVVNDYESFVIDTVRGKNKDKKAEASSEDNYIKDNCEDNKNNKKKDSFAVSTTKSKNQKKHLPKF